MIGLRIAAPLALAASLALLGCSLLLSTPEDQCTSDADCANLGSAFAGTKCIDKTCQAPPPPPDPTWGCIGHVEPPDGGATVKLTVQFLDLINMMPATGLTADLCSKYDPPCAHPLETNLASDAMGNVTVEIGSADQDYLLVESSSYLPYLVFLDPQATPENPVVLLISPGVETGIAEQADVTLDPDGGLILVRTANCENEPAAGVSISISPSDMETRFYVINSAASPTATETDTSGNSGFVNVDQGTPTITGTLGPGGETIGQVTTLVRPGFVTNQILRPTPAP